MSAPVTPVQQYHHYLPGARLRSCARCGQPVDPSKAHYHKEGRLFHRACYGFFDADVNNKSASRRKAAA